MSASVRDVRENDGAGSAIATHTHAAEKGVSTGTEETPLNLPLECEDNPNENLFSNIALESGIPDISVTVPRTTITINDSLQRDCSEF